MVDSLRRAGGGSLWGKMAQQELEQAIQSAPVVVFRQPGCPYCARVELLFSALDLRPGAVKAVSAPRDSALRAALGVKLRASTVPQVFVGGQSLGGHDDLRQVIESGKVPVDGTTGSFGTMLGDAGALVEGGPDSVASANKTAAEEVQGWPVKIDWSQRPFCDAFMNGGNVPDSHAGGMTTFLGGLITAALVFILVTGLSSKGAALRWIVVVPVCFGGFSGLQGVTNT